ncbi:MAG: hypothetical protein KDC53_15920 [Saprospiraceae bacterium]|nr:hypothetical protein [Saprospiraceae bacterium]
MKRSNCIYFLLITIFSFSCRKRDPVLFEIPFRLNFEVQAGLNPFEKHYYAIRNVSTNINALRNTFNVDPDHVLRIRPASAIFSSLHKDLDLDFILEVGISVFEGFDQQNDTDVFLSEQIPINAGRNINVLPFDDDVADVMDTESINFLVALRLRGPTPEFFETNIDIKFVVE